MNVGRAGHPVGIAMPLRNIKRPLHPLVQQLRERRVALGLSQTVLARRMGYNYDNIKKWEQGKHFPTARCLLDWVAALDMVVKLEPKP